MLVAPSEPRIIKSLGKSSSVPERFGADILVSTPIGMLGIQRKAIDDMIASLSDGRLAKEIAQLRRCAISILIVEGRLKWSSDGVLMGRDFGQPWTRTAHRNLLRSVQSEGVWVESTDDASDTVVAVMEMQAWCGKKHTALLRRPGAVSPWGKATNSDWSCHFMQGLDGVGPELARRIIDKFGKPPLKWSVTAEELMTVDGVGPKTAARMIEALS